MTKEMLIREAEKARQLAYAPYSEFYVGAALLTRDGQVYTGCNIENSSYGGTICAERTAFCKAVSQGEREFAAIAIVGGKKDRLPSSPCMPCGICRQFMSEFCMGDFKIYLRNGTKIMEYTLGCLFPEGFELSKYSNEEL